ncbi:uncharacterized protein LOC121764987 [Salvia splendens]|uniref:uncharacterized protein LOC121764987 n=1 Tax=Salvia splendens TaxID=180675 RepID=UPI001C259152|nr:uncharacterized protein LOC121764987 [Salvia splendens]
MGLLNGKAPASESEAQLRLAGEEGVIADVAHAMLYEMLCEYHKMYIAETDEEMKNVLRDIIKALKFNYWDAYVVLMGSVKFRASVAAGWPKQMRLHISGEYSSSTGSHDLFDDAEETPPPVPPPTTQPSPSWSNDGNADV